MRSDEGMRDDLKWLREGAWDPDEKVHVALLLLFR